MATLLESVTAKRLLVTSGAHYQNKELLLPILPTGFPGICFLTFLEMSFAVCLFQTSRQHPSCWNRNLEFYLFPYLRLEADDNVQDEKHVLFHCTHPQMVSLRRKYAFLFSQTGSVCFSTAGNNKLYHFLHELILLYEQASSHTSWLKAFFLQTL